MENLPQHIAIILDGNRRWAVSKGMPSTYGHKEGAKNIITITDYANKIGLKYMTVFAFSTENWKRSKDEVDMLMNLFDEYLSTYTKKAVQNNIRVKIIGTRIGLSDKLIKKISECEEKTKDCTGLTVNIALNYGSREEITMATKKIAKMVQEGTLNISDITEETITDALYTAGTPAPDLLIRTSSEVRLSNFLLWQLAYTEFLFLDKNWPDFKTTDLDNAIAEFSKRNRRFGGKW